MVISDGGPFYLTRQIPQEREIVFQISKILFLILFFFFFSLQSTMVVLHALSEYMINKPPPDLSLNVDIRMAGRKENRYYFNPDTAYVARSSRVRQCCI